MSPFTLPEPTYLESFDGTRLALYETGTPSGPILFLINGLGGNLGAWRFIIEYYRPTFRILSYDYRGMYASESSPRKDYSIEAHTRDATLVMDHFGIKDAVIMGWSMGVQVLLEVYRARPEAARALILANGAYGKPLDKAFPLLKPMARVGMDLLAACAPRLRPFARPFLNTTAPLKVAKAVGFVSKHLDEEVFLNLARDFANLDFDAYRDCTNTLINHDAEDVLDTITVPTLIFAGGRDVYTPAEFSRIMADRIANSRLVMIDDASHYAAVEYPGAIISHMERFFLEHLEE